MLTYAEIETATAELGLDEADVEELHGLLERVEIELVEEIDPALAAAEVERAPYKRGRRKPKTTLDLKPEGTTDSLQLFLKAGSCRPGAAVCMNRDSGRPNYKTTEKCPGYFLACSK